MRQRPFRKQNKKPTTSRTTNCFPEGNNTKNIKEKTAFYVGVNGKEQHRLKKETDDDLCLQRSSFLH